MYEIIGKGDIQNIVKQDDRLGSVGVAKVTDLALAKELVAEVARLSAQTQEAERRTFRYGEESKALEERAEKAEAERDRYKAAFFKMYAHYMGPEACGDFTCNCGDCGLCELKAEMEPIAAEAVQE